MQIIKRVAALDLPDWYIAAGFVRNMVWDHLHGFSPTALNDIDVIYFAAHEISPQSLRHFQKQLEQTIPGCQWQIKNQALMHSRNGDRPYRSSWDAMTYWPEKETAIGVRLDAAGAITIAAPFGVDSLFDGCITHNPAREKSIFEQRVQAKRWLETWPMLRVVCE